MLKITDITDIVPDSTVFSTQQHINQQVFTIDLCSAVENLGIKSKMRSSPTLVRPKGKCKSQKSHWKNPPP